MLETVLVMVIVNDEEGEELKKKKAADQSMYRDTLLTGICQ